MRYLVTAHDMVGEYDSHKTDELLEALQWMGDYRRKGKDVEMQTDDADEGDRGLTFLEMEALLELVIAKRYADDLALLAALDAEIDRQRCELTETERRRELLAERMTRRGLRVSL